MISLAGCFPEPKESPTKGYLKCYVDESLMNVVKDERDAFVNLYSNSKIDLQQVKAREGIAAVLNGETKMFVCSRGLNDEEASFITKSKSDARVFKFCFDAITIIEKANGKLDKIKTDELKQLLLGEKTDVKVYMPEANSGVYEFLKSQLLDGKNPTGAVILKSENDVINKIKTTKNSIGIVGLNTLKNISGVEVLEVGASERSITGIQYYEPLAGYLVNGAYPLVRTTYIIINEVGLHVASGFATFLTSNDGQKIVLSNNLGPATVPVKLIQTN